MAVQNFLHLYYQAPKPGRDQLSGPPDSLNLLAIGIDALTEFATVHNHCRAKVKADATFVRQQV